MVSPWTVAHRSTVYSPKRILTPLKRVDFDPKGERNIENRGTSGYEPISWDEAFDMVAEEIVRVKREVGPAAMLTTASSHHMWGNVGYRFSGYYRFLNLVGFTYAEHNPDSWEGWLWGGDHMWGNSHRLGIPEQYDLLEDALKNTEMIVFWSSDPETTRAGSTPAFESTAAAVLAEGARREDGLHRPVLQPHCRLDSATSGSLLASAPTWPSALAIAFTWLTEDTYDKEYVEPRTCRLRRVEGLRSRHRPTGSPRRRNGPKARVGIPAREIRALAREWASKKTMLAAGGLGGMGGACRSADGQRVGPLHDRPCRHAGHGQTG